MKSPAENPETSRRILVADDDPAILRLVTAIVEKEGYTVVPARDGREAYKLLQADSDFVAGIFDVVMPHIQGPELVRYMKTEKKADEDSRDDDDRRAESQALFRQLLRRSGRLSPEALHHRSTANHAADAD